MKLQKNHLFKKVFFYLVIKQVDVVEIVKRGRKMNFKLGKAYGLLAYNENPFFEIIENGVSSIGIDWKEMGKSAAEFIFEDKLVSKYLPTVIKIRGSF